MIFELAKIDWTAISAIISSIALIGLFFTLREMRNQRITSYKPLVSFTIEALFINNDDNGKPIIWKKELNEPDRVFPNWYHIILENIGLATAINVSIEWNIDYEAIEKEFEAFLADQKFQLTKEIHDGFIQYKYMDYGFTINYKKEKEAIPFMKNEEKVKTQLPEILQSYLSFRSILICERENQFRWIGKELLPVEITLEYFDITDKRYTDEYVIWTDLYVDKQYIKKPGKLVVLGRLVIKKKESPSPSIARAMLRETL
jgi:hypothetical protein